MNKQKITFGKIQLNFKKDEPSETSKGEANEEDDAAPTSGKPFFVFMHFQTWKLVIIFICPILGFGTFGRKEKNSLNNAIEELADDLESQRVKDIMGITEFGRKAKIFDITVSFRFEMILLIQLNLLTV